MTLAVQAPEDSKGPESPEPERRNGALRKQPQLGLDVLGRKKCGGAEAAAALELLAAGASEDEISSRIGPIVGIEKTSFEVRAGDHVAILRLSGSGKSTNLQLSIRLAGTKSGSSLYGRLFEPLSRFTQQFSTPHRLG